MFFSREKSLANSAGSVFPLYLLLPAFMDRVSSRDGGKVTGLKNNIGLEGGRIA